MTTTVVIPFTDKLETLDPKAVKAHVRVPVCGGTWRMVSTGKSYLKIGRKPKEGSNSNLPLYSVVLQLRPVAWVGDLEELPVSEEDYNMMLESGRVGFEIPIWGTKAEDLAGLYTQCLNLGAEHEQLESTILEPIELESKDQTRKVTVYDVRPWLALTTGAIINRVVVEVNNGFANVARGVKTLTADVIDTL